MTGATHMSHDTQYDELAWFYDRHWSSHYHPWAMQMLERTLLQRLPIGSRILDVCCGNGIIAAELVQRGYKVTGIDSSREMLKFATRNAPAAAFVCADAREFGFQSSFDGVFSTFDSLNHILTAEELIAVFRNVCRCLKPGAQFVFDMNFEGAYTRAWNDTCTTIDDEHACFVQGHYDAWSRLAQTDITLFRYSGEWTRTDITLHQRFYPITEIMNLLMRAGFERAEHLDPTAALTIDGRFSDGRGVISARSSRQKGISSQSSTALDSSERFG